MYGCSPVLAGWFILPITRGNCYWNPISVSLWLFFMGFCLETTFAPERIYSKANNKKSHHCKGKKSYREVAYWNIQPSVLWWFKLKLSKAQGLVNWHDGSSCKSFQNTTVLDMTVLGLWTSIKSKLNWFPVKRSKNKEPSQRTNIINYLKKLFWGCISVA